MVWCGDIVVVVPNECYQLLVKTSFQGDDPGPRKRVGRKGRVRISVTLPTLVIISYSRARIWGRGYHGTP